MCKFVRLEGDLIKTGWLKDPNADTAFGKSRINRIGTDIISRLVFAINHSVILCCFLFRIDIYSTRMFNVQPCLMVMVQASSIKQQTSSTCFECLLVTLIR